MNFGEINGPDRAVFLGLQRSLPHVLLLSPHPEAALLGRPQLSIPALLTFHAFLVIPFLIPPFPLNRHLFLGLLTALLISIVRSTTGLGQAEDYVLSIICVGFYQRFVSFFVCSPPPQKNVALARPGKEGYFGTWGLKDRLLALWAMYNNTRGVGWAWEVRTRGYASTPALPRWTFVREQLRKLALILALTVPSHILYPTVAEVVTAPFWVRSYRSNLCVFGIYSIVNGSYILHSVVSVSLGFSTPEEWPPLFGSITSCWSVRRAWGFWHQSLTLPALQHATYFSRLLGVRQSHLLTVLTGFTLSAVLHALPAWTISRTDGGMVVYFLLQAVGIGLEEFCGRPLGGVLGVQGRAGRVVGCVWMLAWFATTNVLFVEGLVAVGMQPVVDWRWALGYETVRIN